MAAGHRITRRAIPAFELCEREMDGKRQVGRHRGAPCVRRGHAPLFAYSMPGFRIKSAGRSIEVSCVH